MIINENILIALSTFMVATFLFAIVIMTPSMLITSKRDNPERLSHTVIGLQLFSLLMVSLSPFITVAIRYFTGNSIISYEDGNANKIVLASFATALFITVLQCIMWSVSSKYFMDEDKELSREISLKVLTLPGFVLSGAVIYMLLNSTLANIIITAYNYFQ